MPGESPNYLKLPIIIFLDKHPDFTSTPLVASRDFSVHCGMPQVLLTPPLAAAPASRMIAFKLYLPFVPLLSEHRSGHIFHTCKNGFLILWKCYCQILIFYYFNWPPIIDKTSSSLFIKVVFGFRIMRQRLHVHIMSSEIFSF